MNVLAAVCAKWSKKRVLNGTASIIAMKPAPAATHRGRGVATKGVTAKQTLNRIRVWRLGGVLDVDLRLLKFQKNQ